MQVDTRTVPANGAELHCEVRGAGPTVLFIAGATGDAGHFDAVADALADRFRIVTYDRRGNSRSPKPPGWVATSVGEQAEDAAGLIEALGGAPLVVFGTSAGGAIAAELVLRRPEIVQGAILHEPLILTPLGEQVAEAFKRSRATTEAAIAAAGPRAGVDAFVAMAAGDARWQERVAPAVRERMLGNGETLFGIDTPAFWGYRPAAGALAAIGRPMRVLRGRETALPFMERVCGWLAGLWQTEVGVMPGGHIAYLDGPAAFAAALRPHLGRVASAAHLSGEG
jgi:pimeloyl-ACP methyl ester carboxylesterase